MENEFEAIQTLVTLARSGAYQKKEPLLEEMLRLFPEMSEEQLHKVVVRCFGKTYVGDKDE